MVVTGGLCKEYKKEVDEEKKKSNGDEEWSERKQTQINSNICMLYTACGYGQLWHSYLDVDAIHIAATKS